MYWIKTHNIVKRIFKNVIWDKPNTQKNIYLTFDDGPIPEVTEWVLDVLKKHNVKATFFCVGENIQKHPIIYARLQQEGHAVGNHTFNHNNGWKFDRQTYLQSVEKTQRLMLENKTKIFRPPYGKLTPNQYTALRKLGYKIIMWDVLSADFDLKISGNKCLKNVTKNTTEGSIVVFHDNIKSFQTLQYTLPKYLEFLNEKGFKTAVID